MKECILEEGRHCDNCGECLACDLDKNKTCDNCGKCLDIPDYAGIMIDEIHTGDKIIKLKKSNIKGSKK